jgi:co-chaperonin GroES (HSP10)
MNWKPLFDRVLLKAITAEHKVGGLFIPDTSTNLKKGIVIAAGEGKNCKTVSDEEILSLSLDVAESKRLAWIEGFYAALKHNSMSVKEQQEVLFKHEDGTPITLEEQQYLILRETDLWMKN